LSEVLSDTYDPETWPSQLMQPKSGKLYCCSIRPRLRKLPPPDASGIGTSGDRTMILAGDVGGTKVHLALYEL
jgi:hypothetical protein